jgi:hypothetical protein
VVALSAPVDALPLVAMGPIQPPVAVHEVALVLLQVSVALAPPVRLLGLAESITVGEGGAVAAVTDTVAVTVAGVVPAAPAQLKV